MAIETRRPPAGVIHHSDQGVQYAAYDDVEPLQAYGFASSMARTGNPYDHAVAERCMKPVKAEEVDLGEDRPLDDVQNRLPYCIDQVSNRKWLHSALGYRPPEACEALWTAAQVNPTPCRSTLTQTIQT